MLTHRPSRLPASRAEDIRTLKAQCIAERHHTPGACARNIFTGNGKHGCASETQSVSIVFQFDILVIVINMLYATYVVKSCKRASYAEISSQYRSL